MAAAAVIGDHRRGKTALFLIVCGWAGAAPHFWLEGVRSLFPAITLAFVLGGYCLRTVLNDRDNSFENSNPIALEPPADQAWPTVDVLVAARDEQTVVNRLVERLATL
ncbi:MAG TPA: glycosyltransferase family 2 protein, partial [Prochlorococcus sp.]